MAKVYFYKENGTPAECVGTFEGTFSEGIDYVKKWLPTNGYNMAMVFESIELWDVVYKRDCKK